MRSRSDSRALIISRAAHDLKVPESEIVFALGHPKDHGCDVWQGTIFHQPSREVTLRATTIYARPTEENLYKTFLKRKAMWKPRWQEAIEERAPYRTWDEDVEWWNHADPQRAWDECPSGEAMLWILSRPDFAYPTWIYLSLGVILAQRFGVVSDPILDAVKRGAHHTLSLRSRVAREWEKLPWDTATPEEARRRAPYCVALATYGHTQPFFELAYFARKFFDMPDEDLAEGVRLILPQEQWTKG